MPAATVQAVSWWSPDHLTAIGTLLLALATFILTGATIVLAAAATRQLPLLQAQLKLLNEQLGAAQAAEVAAAARQRAAQEEAAWQQIEAKTSEACERYFTNVVIHSVTQRFFRETKNGSLYDRADLPKYEHDLITFLNYLNALAVGVEQGIYSGDIVRDHLYNTIVKVVDTIVPALLTTPAKWQPLINLRGNWSTTKPNYRRGPIPR